MKERLRGRLVTWGRYVLSVVFLIWLATTIDWSRTLTTVSQLTSFTVVAVVILSAVNGVLWALMWWTLITPRDDSRLGGLLYADLTIKFVNGLLPSRLAGRTIAPIALRQYGKMSGSEAVALTVLHTGLYAICYGLFCLGGIFVLAPRLDIGILALLALATVGYLGAGAVVFLGGYYADRLGAFLRPIEGVARRVPIVGDRLQHAVQGVTDSIIGSKDVFRDRSVDRIAVLGYIAAWTVATVVLPGARFWLLLEGLTGTNITFFPIPLYLVTAYSVTILPITPGGIGVTEATSVFVFVSLGFPEAAVVPAVFLDRLVGVYLPSLVGWLPATRIDLSLDSTDGS